MTLARAYLWRAQTRIALLALVVLLSAGASARGQEPDSAPVTRSATQSTVPAYTIGPSDILWINVWKEPDLTREVTVRLDGMITFPLLGDMQASGLMPSQLAESLTAGLHRYIETPQVTVGVVQTNSARFFVVGQVGKSGEFPLSNDTTVLQGLALAGGFRDFAKTESIVIVRRDQTTVSVNYKRIADGKDLSQNILLAPGDTVVVP